MAEDRNWELNRIVIVTERNRFRDRGNRQRDRATEIMKAQQEMETMTSLEDVEEEASHSCLQKLLSSLADGSAGSSGIEAAKQIGDLAKTSARMRAYLASAGVVPPLISILISSSSSSRAKEAALLALLNLALRNQKNKVAIVRSGALPVLVEILRRRSDVEQKLRELAAAALLTLSASDANKPEIGSSGSTPLLVEILNSSGSAASSSSISIQAKVDAVMALYNLSTHPANVAIIQAAGAAAPLIRLLKDCKRSSRVAEKITALMETMMVGFDATRRRVVEEEGGLLAMVEVLEEGTAQGKEHAVGALLALCENDRDLYRAPMLKEGVIPGLLELTVEGTEIAKQKAQRLLCLLRDTVPASAAVRNPMAPASVLKSLVYDIAAHVDNAGSAETESAKTMLTEMVQRSMAEEVEEEEVSQKKQQKEGSKLVALPSPTRRWGRRRLMSLKQ